MSEGKSYRFLVINQYFVKCWHYSVILKKVQLISEIDILLAITLGNLRYVHTGNKQKCSYPHFCNRKNTHKQNKNQEQQQQCGSLL